jgi:AcrR family transcriptional regulator
MPEVVKPRRRYDATRRREQADRTRADVLAAARRLFVTKGYAATSVRDIADEAGVSVQTLYDGFGSKAGLFSRLAEIAVVGDDEPVALAEREAAQRVVATESAPEVVRRFAALIRGIWERFDTLLPVARAAAAVDPELAAEYRGNVLEARHAGQRHVVEHLDAIGSLRAGLDVERATDELWAISGPDLYEALVLERRWSPDEYESWLADTLVRLLLGKNPRRTGR